MVTLFCCSARCCGDINCVSCIEEHHQKLRSPRRASKTRHHCVLPQRRGISLCYNRDAVSQPVWPAQRIRAGQQHKLRTGKHHCVFQQRRGISTGLASSQEVQQESKSESQQESNADSHSAQSKAKAPFCGKDVTPGASPKLQKNYVTKATQLRHQSYKTTSPKQHNCVTWYHSGAEGTRAVSPWQCQNRSAGWQRANSSVTPAQAARRAAEQLRTHSAYMAAAASAQQHTEQPRRALSTGISSPVSHL